MGIKFEIVCAIFMMVLMATVYSAPKRKYFGKEDLQVQVSHYNADEHDFLGNQAALPLNIGNVLTLPNDVKVTFGAIVALAGDFYGIPESPIIDTTLVGANVDEENRTKRFEAAYGTLATEVNVNTQVIVDKLAKMIKEDQAAREARGELHSQGEYDIGGTWVRGAPISNGMMMKLAQENYDNFQPQAQQAYLIGHTLAVQKAQEAAKQVNEFDRKKELMEAYSMEAFADHFLTECFSAGHIRTPRVELKTMVPSVGDYLSAVMHDEDCKYGLNVVNSRGDKWTAYGDKYLNRPNNKNNLKFVTEAIQKSVQQVTEAFQFPERKTYPVEITKIIPFVDPEAQNNTPLFQLKDGILYQRNNLRNLQETKMRYVTAARSLAFIRRKPGARARKNSALPPI